MPLDNRSPRTLGDLGEVGPLAFGCWRFVGHELDHAIELIETSLDLGMNLIDTADVYGLDWGGTAFGQAEELLGSVLSARPDLRARMVLATKGGIWPGRPYDSSNAYLTAALERSLRRLKVDHVDLYQIHRPDLYAHPAEVAETLDGFVERGLVKALGVSNHTVAQVDALAAHLDNSLVSTQPEFSVTHLDPVRDGTLDQCMRLGLIPLAWSPLGGGSVVTGSGLRTALAVALDDIGARFGIDRAAVALAFVLAHPAKPVAILGTQSLDRLRTASQALDVALEREDVYRLIAASEGRPLP